ncbi:MAG: hypothetical protein LBI95_04170 [Holosporales bacterium]|nr:hypothetical protein [Holosporales bacterium]
MFSRFASTSLAYHKKFNIPLILENFFKSIVPRGTLMFAMAEWFKFSTIPKLEITLHLLIAM